MEIYLHIKYIYIEERRRRLLGVRHVCVCIKIIELEWLTFPYVGINVVLHVGQGSDGKVAHFGFEIEENEWGSFLH